MKHLAYLPDGAKVLSYSKPRDHLKKSNCFSAKKSVRLYEATVRLYVNLLIIKYL